MYHEGLIHEIHFHSAKIHSLLDMKRKILRKIAALDMFKSVNLDDDCYFLIIHNEVMSQERLYWNFLSVVPYEPQRISLVMIPVYTSRYEQTGYEYFPKGIADDPIIFQLPIVKWTMPTRYQKNN